MNHLIISREYPPASYPGGGIGTYVANIARLMAERGETVHVIGERWNGAPRSRETNNNGRLILHRIGIDDPIQPHWLNNTGRIGRELAGLRKTAFPEQWFAWHAAVLAEWLIDHHDIHIIEGQEWEAPLYYFLLRRALGIGPKRCPPCIVHLHSASEFIRQFNGGLDALEPYLRMKRMEEFCIGAADALLCPSEYLARQCIKHYELSSQRIEMIRYPIGSIPLIERDPEVWARGSICFVGRLEPRKGIIEWIEAATRVAQEDSSVEFDIVGADNKGLWGTLARRIPRTLQARFRFHGSKTRSEVINILARARAAVVPSRWENFPNVCIEAMASGLPIVATRLGGMVELVQDGRTGWLTPDTGVAGMIDGLADALRRCLAASPAECAFMGRAAAETVRRVCDNERTVDEQIAFRAKVARSGAYRSIASASRQRNWLRPATAAAHADCKGAGIVVRVRALPDALPTLESIFSQTVRPSAVVIVYQSMRSAGQSPFTAGGLDKSVVLLHRPHRTGADAWNAGFETLRAEEKCSFWLFLDEFDNLLPDYISQIEKVLKHKPEVGIVAVWTERLKGPRPLEAPLHPEPEYQLRANEIPPASAFRAEALANNAPFRPGIPREYDVWDLANKVLARGWQATAYPEILAQRRVEQPIIAWPESTALCAIRGELLDHFSNIYTPELFRLIDDSVPIPSGPPHNELTSEESFSQFVVSRIKIAALDPRRAAQGIIRRSRAVLKSQAGPGRKRAAM